MAKAIFAAQSLLHEGQRQLTTERLINMFPEASPNARLQVALRSVPGLSSVAQSSTAARVWAMEATPLGIYILVGGQLEFWDGITLTNIGAVSSGPGTLSWNGTQLAIVASQGYWIYNGSTIAAVTGGAFNDIGAVDYIDGYFIRSEADGQRWDITGLLDGTTLNALDFASAEHRPDKIKRAMTSGGLVWLLGSDTVEVWQNTGATDFPFTRVSSTILEKGLRDTPEAAILDNTLFWNSGESRAYRQLDFQPQKISTHAVDASLDAHPTATCFTYQYDGHDFYVVRFPDRPAWVYDAATQSWHERSTGVNREAWEVTSATHFNGKWYAGTKDGHICEFTGFQDIGNEIRREAISRNVTNGGERFVVNSVDVRCNAGAGGTVMSSYSSDGGQTFSLERTRSLGAVGDYGRRTQWNALGQHREFSFKLACTDNVDFAIYEAGVNVGG